MSKQLCCLLWLSPSDIISDAVKTDSKLISNLTHRVTLWRVKKSETVAAGLMISKRQQEKMERFCVVVMCCYRLSSGRYCAFFLLEGLCLQTHVARHCCRLASCCQLGESLSHGFIDGQSRPRHRLKCQVDSQIDSRVAAGDLDWTSKGPEDTEVQ